MSKIYLKVALILVVLVTISCSSGGDGASSGPGNTPNANLVAPGSISISEGYQSLNVKWRAVPGATGYELYLDTQQNLLVATQQTANYQEFLDITGTELNITGLQNDTTYYFIMRSVGDNATSPYTDLSLATPKAIKPKMPSGFSAAYVSTTSVALSWKAASDATNGYRLYRAAKGGAFQPVDENLGAGTINYADNSINPSVVYDYQLIAVNQAGDSPTASLVYVPPPQMPSAFSVTPISATEATISWTQGDSITDSYELTRSENSGATQAIGGVIVNSNATMSYQDSGLVGGNTYTYNVVAVNAGGKSDALVGNYAAPVKPSAPVLTASVAAGPTVTINWTNVDTATTKLVLSRADANTNPNAYTSIATFNAPNLATSFSDNGVNAGNSYHYQLQAYNGSIVADASTITVNLPALVTIPSNFQASMVTTTSVKLNWNVVSSADSYNLYRADVGGTATLLTTITSGATTTYTDNSAVAYTKYDYQIEAVNVLGKSGLASFNYIPLPATPTNFTAVTNSATAATISWSEGDKITDSYRLTRSDNGATPVQIGGVITKAQATDTQISYADSGLLGGHTYTYNVVAVNTSGQSAKPLVGTYNSPVTPTTPTLSALVAAGPTVDLTWSGVDTATTRLELSRVLSGSTAAPTLLSTTNAPNLGTGYSDTGVTAGTTYDYQLVAFNGTISSTPLVSTVSVPALATTPGNFQATYVSPTSVKLSWSLVSSASSYKLYRTGAGGAFTNPPTTLSGTTASYSDTSVLASTKYDYQIIASNVLGDSTAATLSYVPRPAAPINFTATTDSDTLVTISWTEGDSIADSYSLMRSDNGAAAVQVGGIITKALPTDTLISYQDSVVGGHTYSYSVTAVNVGGSSAALSGNYTAPVKPATPLLTANVTSGPVVTLSWSGVDAITTSLVLSRSVAGANTYSAINTTTAPNLGNGFSDNTALAGRAYDYQLLAYNGSVVVSNVAQQSVTLPPVPTVPGAFTAAYSSASSIKLSWTGDGTASSYELYRAIAGGTPSLLNGSIAGTDISYIDNTASALALYDYKLVALNVSGTAAATTSYAPPLPATPINFSATTQSVSAATISWSAGGNFSESFELTRSDNGAVAVPIGGIIANAGGVVSYSETALVAGHSYTYSIVAVNASGKSPIALSGSYIAPVQPATPVLAANLASGPIVKLSWSGVDPVTTQLVLSRSDAGANAYTTIYTGNAPNLGAGFDDSTVTVTKTYDYKLLAYNGTVVVSNPATQTIAVSASAPASAPTGFGASYDSATSIKLSWTSDGSADSYTLTRIAGGVTTQLSGALPGTALSYIDNVDPLNLYQYQIVAVNVLGSSAPVSVNYAPPVPAVPSLFSAAYNSTTGAVDLTWSGDAALTASYKLERSDTSVTPAAPVLISDTIAGTATSFSDSGALPGIVYSYQLSAINKGGASNPATTSFTAVPVAPSALAWQQLNNTSIRVSWTAGALSNGFVVLREDTPGSGIQTQVGANLPATATSVDDTPLLNSHAYRYEVYAVNATGTSASTFLDLTTLAKPPLPTGFNATVNAGPVVELSWNPLDVSIDGLVLTRIPLDGSAATDILVQIPGNTIATTFSDSGVVAGASYDYRLTTSAGVMQADPVTVTNIAIPAVVAAPSNLTLGDVTSTEANLSWLDNSNNEDNFILERAEQTGPTTWSAFTVVNTFPANTVTAVDSGAAYQAGKVYKYHVIAQNLSSSVLSNEVTTESPPLDSNGFLSFYNKTAPRFQETATTAQAYYDAIDPLAKKTTLANWKLENGFVEGSGLPKDTPAIYVNDADLGFARRMFVNAKAPGSLPGLYNVASYVENYATLSDALTADPVLRESKIIATVAMEYTEPPNSDVVMLANAPKFDFYKTYTQDISLPAATYVVNVFPDYFNPDPNNTFSLKISDLASGAVYIDAINQGFPMPRLFSQNATSASQGKDFSAASYRFDLTAAATLHFDLSAQMEMNVFINRENKVIAQAAATVAGGTAAINNIQLSPGVEYTIRVGSGQLYATGAVQEDFNFTVTDGTTSSTTVGSLFPGTNNDPKNPNNFSYTISVPPGSTGLFSFSAAMVNSTSPITPVIFIGDTTPASVGTDTFIELRSSLYNGNAAGSRIEVSLPDGDYSAAVATDKFDLNFALNIFDVNANADFACLGGAPVIVNPSWGPNPFVAGNPRCNFNLNTNGTGSSAVNIRASNVDPVNPGKPRLKLLGVPNEYRNVIAFSVEKAKSVPTATLHETLAAGNYVVAVADSKVGDTISYTLTATDSANGGLLINQQGSWNPSPGLNINAPEMPKYPLVIPAGGATVDIVLSTPFSGGAKPTTTSVIYLLDSTNTVIDQTDSIRGLSSALEADVLAGDYQVVLTSASTYDTAYRSGATVRVFEDNVLTHTFNGVGHNLDAENPFSPRVLKFIFTLAQASHVRVELESDFGTKMYLLGKGDRKFVTFYTYIGQKGYDDLVKRGVIGAVGSPYPAGLAVGDRVLAANLDGKGDKYQPGVCNVCHGGAPKSLQAGVYPDQGDTNAGFLAWDMDLFKYDTQANSAHSRANLEPMMREFNRTVLSVQRDPTRDIPGNNTKITTRNEMIYGWYGGAGLPNPFDGSFVPRTWQPDSITGIFQGNPDGSDQLYLNVVKPTCRLCHVQRDGITTQLSNRANMPLAFQSYSDFIGYKDDIESLVYDEARMPLAKRTYDHFWSRGQAELLAQFLDLPTAPFTRYDAAKQILKPGRPIALAPYRAQIDPTISGNVDIRRQVATGTQITVDGSYSLFAKNYNWRVITGTNGVYDLLGATTATPKFTPLADQVYTLELIVDDGFNHFSDPAYLIVNATTGYVPVKFSTDILPPFDRSLGRYGNPVDPLTGTAPPQAFDYCLDCHSNKEDYLLYDNPITFNKRVEFNSNTFVWSLSGTPAEVYAAIRDRVNLNDPLDSRILAVGNKKHHAAYTPYGWGFDDPAANWQHYNLFLQWILQGAPNN